MGFHYAVIFNKMKDPIVVIKHLQQNLKYTPFSSQGYSIWNPVGVGMEKNVVVSVKYWNMCGGGLKKCVGVRQ